LRYSQGADIMNAQYRQGKHQSQTFDVSLVRPRIQGHNLRAAWFGSVGGYDPWL
jgi:hypothetical protein